MRVVGIQVSVDELKGVLDITPLLGWVVAILLKDDSVSVESLATVVGAPDNNDPFNVVSVASVLGEVDVVRGTELSRAAALMIVVCGEVKHGTLSIRWGLGRAVVVQLENVAVVRGISAVLGAID